MGLTDLLSKCDYINWLCQNYRYLDEKRKPRIKHIVYIEQLINGVGVQTDKDLFEQYLDVWRKSKRLKYYYNKDLDCTEYVIDGFIAFRKYDYGCIY